MIFTRNQLEEILKIIDSNIIQYSVGILGTDILSKDDKSLLKNFGVDINKLDQDFPEYIKMYHWGRLSQILGNLNASNVEYKDFIKYLKMGQYDPLTSIESSMLEVSKQRTYSHIKKLGEDIKNNINNNISNIEQINRPEYEKIIKESLNRGIQDRKSLQQIVGDIGGKTQDWTRNLGRLVDTEFNNIFQEGRARIIKEKHGGDAKVWKNVFPGACRWCIKLYLTKGLGSEPIIFTLDELISNGTNVDKKTSDWLATLYGIHPFCRCTLYYLQPGTKWNKETKRFEFPKIKESKYKDIRSKIKIIVGDKKFYV